MKPRAKTGIQPVDPNKSLAGQLAPSSPDLLRDMLSTFIQWLMGAEADAVCGAGYRRRNAERVNSDTEAAHGQLLPGSRLERRKRVGRALTSVVATC